MEEDNGGHRSDTDVSAQMAPGVSSSPATLVSSITSNPHKDSPLKHSSLDVGGKNDSGVLSSEVPNEVIVPAESSEKPAEGAENGGIPIADELKADDTVVGVCMGAGVDVQEVATEKGAIITGTSQENFSLDNGPTLKGNGGDVKDLGVVLTDSLDDDQPLCMVFKKGKLGEDGLVALAGRKPTEERSSSPQDVLPTSVSSPGIDKVKTSGLPNAEFAEGVVKKVGQGEGGVGKSGTMKNRPSNGLERSSRKGSMETRRAPRHTKKRRYTLSSIVYLAGSIDNLFPCASFTFVLFCSLAVENVATVTLLL